MHKADAKVPGKTEVSFLLSNAAWDSAGNMTGNEAQLATAFEGIGRRIAGAVGGPPVTIYLMGGTMEPRQTIVVK